MESYSLMEIVNILKEQSQVSDTVEFKIDTHDTYYDLRIYNRFDLSSDNIDILICSLNIDKNTYKINTAHHNYLLITEFNKDIIIAISNLIGSKIFDLGEYISSK